MITETEKTKSAELEALGFSLKSTQATGIVEDERTWLRYHVALSLNGREIWHGDYFMGSGHVEWKEEKLPMMLRSGNTDESKIALQLCRKPFTDFVDKQTHASAIELVANHQKVRPSLADVMHSLLSDAEADNRSFDDWAGELGYDTDSIKARNTYEACAAIGKALRLGIPHDIRTKAQETLQNY